MLRLKRLFCEHEWEPERLKCITYQNDKYGASLVEVYESWICKCKKCGKRAEMTYKEKEVPWNIDYFKAKYTKNERNIE